MSQDHCPNERTPVLEQELEQRKLEIELLREITDLVGTQFDLQKVFSRIAHRARQLIGAGTVLIPILSAEQDSYTYRAADGEFADELLGETLPIEIGLCGWVLRNQQPWWQGAIETLSDEERSRWKTEAGTHILVPLLGKKCILGGIACLNKVGGGEFSKDDLKLLNLFASQISTAIESAIVFDALNEANQQAEKLQNELQDTNRKLLESNEELQHLAVHDPLTSLPNRVLIMDRLQQGIYTATRNAEGLALIMIDLDNFKEINDTLGHAVGDQLLRAIGERFCSTLRSADTLGRLGGDEFAVVAPSTSIEDAIVIVTKLQQALQSSVVINGSDFSIGASMGIALYPQHGTTTNSLLKAADVAMYAAKRVREEYCVYDPVLDRHSAGRLELLGDLRAAISNQTIGIALQPKLDLFSGEIVGAEALARWLHDGKGPIGPDEFVPMLEQTGLIRPFTLQILEMSIQACDQCRSQGYDFSIAVNLSMHNLRDPNLPDRVEDLLKHYKLPPQRLVLEITESAIMSDPEYTMDVLKQLYAMGVRLSIDDFGTGYSSLSYLKRLPVHQLKIDRSFVHDIIKDKDDAAIVRSTVDLAHNLGLTVVAEGVENEATLNMVRQYGAELAQGFYIGRPMTLEKFLEYLQTSPLPTRMIATNQLKVPA